MGHWPVPGPLPPGAGGSSSRCRSAGLYVPLAGALALGLFLLQYQRSSQTSAGGSCLSGVGGARVARFGLVIVVPPLVVLEQLVFLLTHTTPLELRPQPLLSGYLQYKPVGFLVAMQMFHMRPMNHLGLRTYCPE